MACCTRPHLFEILVPNKKQEGDFKMLYRLRCTLYSYNLSNIKYVGIVSKIKASFDHVHRLYISKNFNAYFNAQFENSPGDRRGIEERTD